VVEGLRFKRMYVEELEGVVRERRFGGERREE